MIILNISVLEMNICITTLLLCITMMSQIMSYLTISRKLKFMRNYITCNNNNTITIIVIVIITISLHKLMNVNDTYVRTNARISWIARRMKGNFCRGGDNRKGASARSRELWFRQPGATSSECPKKRSRT